MREYLNIIIDSFTGYGHYLWTDITQPSWHSFFYGLVTVSLLFWLWEIMLPWRKEQAVIRRGFWLDGFYMFFNVFLFSLIGYAALTNVLVHGFNQFLGWFGIKNLVMIHIQSWPVWAKLLTMFVVRDFIQFNVHRLLHRVPTLWNFHKVHHSVREMGFAAQFRYHWMETLVYRTIEYIPLAMIGFGVQDFFVVHMFAITMGHFNHSNVKLPLGPFKYIFNNPQMHIWHHARDLPEDRPYGMNYGLTLSLWDYLFGTAYIPSNGRDIPLGFPGIETFPEDFTHQVLYPLFQQNLQHTKEKSTLEKGIAET